ncbi:MAG TPA: efflux RND transporter periplasmic adaptor subunit [Sediminibacterium sp.]|uniref:efflux RND transporter periplasmic adaptor subunit n=1 Tax=Sediminibacterium sp. TaxID=1917865 RepID=UPI0008C559F1|nr:efflux RND transporter periplasmic adaptor subunit [Sediminibacterium sp.]OHC86246.1 MAG: efflux transporter periplasmic adaptor subunit [Sphingobacteriia bacterium RIFOXYC2_FULL_35_18]OHC89759.1 MAG: efflux transporter periplasmic adaptor subunit [Sphingobacteriia bacterium RIFOXYD2_FULL_35_12]HLD54345.1 efflux RND transporter periplasmic adaptor subunit [Sediminibacterium sp.]
MNTRISAQNHRFLPFFIFAILAFVACKDNEKAGTADLIPSLPVVEVVQKDTLLQTDYVADIQAVQNVEVRARVQGFLEKILVDEGKEVRKGQPLFQINDLEYKTELAKAKAAVSNAMAEAKAAELELGRTKILVEKNVIAKTEYELAVSKVSAAKAKIDEALSAQTSAETKLSYTFIRAPFDGIIDRIPLKMGSLIDPGALLTTISDVHNVFAYFNISENEYLQYRKAVSKGLKEDRPVNLVLADGTQYGYTGKIETSDGEFNENTGAIAFRARFPNPNKLLKHGASGKARLTTSVENAIIIPQKSTFEIQDKTFVFIVDKDNIIQMRAFKPGRRVAQYYIVEAGLKPGENIVYEGVQSIRQGAKIKPVKMNLDSLMQTALTIN